MKIKKPRKNTRLSEQSAYL